MLFINYYLLLLLYTHWYSTYRTIYYYYYSTPTGILLIDLHIFITTMLLLLLVIDMLYHYYYCAGGLRSDTQCAFHSLIYIPIGIRYRRGLCPSWIWINLVFIYILLMQRIFINFTRLKLCGSFNNIYFISIHYSPQTCVVEPRQICWATLHCLISIPFVCYPMPFKHALSHS